MGVCKFKIGDLVAHKMHVEPAKANMAVTDCSTENSRKPVRCVWFKDGFEEAFQWDWFPKEVLVKVQVHGAAHADEIQVGEVGRLRPGGITMTVTGIGGFGEEADWVRCACAVCGTGVESNYFSKEALDKAED